MKNDNDDSLMWNVDYDNNDDVNECEQKLCACLFENSIYSLDKQLLNKYNINYIHKNVEREIIQAANGKLLSMYT